MRNDGADGDTLVITEVTLRPVEPVSAPGDEAALVSVRDSGPGIAPEHVPHLFDRFYRASTRSSGLGLGLYISRILVEAHGGRIWVESRPGQGSTFTIALPRHP